MRTDGIAGGDWWTPNWGQARAVELVRRFEAAHPGVRVRIEPTVPDGLPTRIQTALLRGISLDIPDGAFVVLVGPSGCGKSTLLRMIAGLETIDRGEIRIGDRLVNTIPPKDRDVAMVFQNYALYPHMTVAANLGFSLKLRGEPAAVIERKVAEAATIPGLQPYLDRLPRQLSGGQRQRVAMGRAIVRSPRVFLFDEPLSNLDAGLRAQMRAEIKDLHQRLKTTTVYVTHDQIEAMTMGDTIIVLRDGVVQQAGAPLEAGINSSGSRRSLSLALVLRIWMSRLYLRSHRSAGDTSSQGSDYLTEETTAVRSRRSIAVLVLARGMSATFARTGSPQADTALGVPAHVGLDLPRRSAAFAVLNPY